MKKIRIIDKSSFFSHQKGPCYVSFTDGTTVSYSLPAMNVTGIIMGDRIIEYVGTIEFRDEEHNLKYVAFSHAFAACRRLLNSPSLHRCDVVFNPKEAKDGGYFGFWSKQLIPSDHFKGTIAKTKETLSESKKSKKLEEEPLCNVQGSWLGCIEFDGVK